MRCPSCNAKRMSTVELPEGPRAFVCGKCNGHWIPTSSYQMWLDEKGTIEPEKSYTEVEPELHDSQGAKICPECGKFLLRYKVGHGLPFLIESCSGCGGVWLDEHEWDVLKNRNLHDEIHRVFSTAWQKQIREQDRSTRIEEAYLKRLGETDFQRLKDIQAWIHAHPQRQSILTYLQ